MKFRYLRRLLLHMNEVTALSISCSLYLSAMEEENRRGEEDMKTIIVEREEKLLLSHSEHNPTLRIRKFLNPSVVSHTQASPVPSMPLLSETIAQNLTEWPSNIHFKGWRNPQAKWKEWMDQLAPSRCASWNQSGICDSLLGSIYKFEIDKNLILGLVEYWCPETNTFVFPWGESTITLEDIFILGGFSVVGLPVSSPLDGDELSKISDEIHEEYRAFYRSKARKASFGQWLSRFMGSTNSELEHVAFISFWLSRFVFPEHPIDIVRKQVFPAAIHLAKGTRIALAPAILSGLYRELTSLKERVVDFGTNAGDISVWGPFQLVQMWVLEHFPPLRPNSINSLEPGEPRVARWHETESKSELSIVRSTLCSSENFQWRPYVVTLNNWRCPLFYKEREELLDVQADDYELMSFFCCLRACEIVGLDGLIQQYNPHRVARQFGFDQDLPGKFSRRNAASLESDWKIYEKSTRNAKSFVRSRFLESSVTSRYFQWWRSSMSVREARVKKIFEQEEMWKNFKSSNQYSSKNVKKLSGCSTKTVEKNGTHEHSKAEPEHPVSTHTSPGAETEEVASEDEDDKLLIETIFKLDKHQNTHKSSSPGCSTKTVEENGTHEHSKAEPEQPVSTHTSPRAEAEVASEDEDDKLPIAIICKLQKHQDGIHKSSSSPNTQVRSTLMSSTLSEVGGKKRKPSELTDKESVEKIVEKEGKLGSSAKNPFNAEEYKEGTIEKPVYIDDYGGRRRRSWRETSEAVVILD